MPLTVYKASAGSGKTFAITREYIHLLFRDADNYKRTLGVTFTNKATAEMKSRIVAELDKIARGEKSGYTADLQKAFGQPPALLQQNARNILSKILHDYSHFTILTIDSFFQRIIRAFAREIGYYQGFDIELDQKKILIGAIDQMIMELDKSPNLKDWLVRFAEDKIEDGGSWDVNRDIEKLGNEIFKENFKEIGNQLIEKITNKQFLDEFSQSLEKIKLDFEHNFRQKGIDALTIIKEHGLTTNDFKGKSRSIHNFFEKLVNAEKFDKFEINKTQLAHYNDVEVWKTKNKLKDLSVESAYNAGLNRLLGEIIEALETQFPIYQTALEVQKHLYVLGVVADLLKNIREYTSGRNIFMISDTAQFLQRLISGSDAPFVYERTGTFVRHFMIDEFQDTSSLQWHNFKPLIINSLAENNANWVVGDVKQSIYRWRNSDWTILSEKIFNELKPHSVTPQNLEYNWRSSRNVIQFNNTFFRNACELLLAEVADQQNDAHPEHFINFKNLIDNAYDEFAQLIPSSNDTERGFVYIEQIPKSDDRDVKFTDQSLAKLPSIIETAIDKGYALKDIAILVRRGVEGNMVSEYLLKYQKQNADKGYRYDVISNDSLLLKNSEAIKWIIAAFSYVVSPDDALNKAFLEYEYQSYILSDVLVDKNLDDLFRSRKEAVDAFFSRTDLRQYPVFELSNLIIEHFGLSALKGELPFIQAFQDMLQDYMRKESADLNSFLLWWEENQDKRVISMPDSQDAIRLMTLHSSKGLEFKVVIMPFADWQMMKTGGDSNILWCSSNAAPFNSLDLLPLNLTSKLKNTIFGGEYYREEAMSYIDNLNLLYVAFTRAVDALYVMVPETGKDTVNKSMGNLISLSLQAQRLQPSTVDYPAITLPNFYNAETASFSYGELTKNISEPKKGPQPFEANSYIVRNIGEVVHQVIPSTEYFSTDGPSLQSRINSGKIMHEVFQQIKTQNDISSAIQKLILEGKISETEYLEIEKDINQLITNKSVTDWFSPKWSVRTEADILMADGTIVRPDRVMINGDRAIVVDYKFGETEHASYIRQVKKYVQNLSDMGFKAEGFLWYVRLNKVVAVNETAVQGTLF